jgi:hypothetical protein
MVSILSLEATLTLLVMSSLVMTALSIDYTPVDMGHVAMYKQASDFFEVIVYDGSLDSMDEERMESLLNALDSDAGIVIEADGNKMEIGNRDVETKVILERTCVTEDVRFVRARLTYGK